MQGREHFCPPPFQQCERVGEFQFGGGWAAVSRGGSYRLAGLTSERSVARFSMSSFRLLDLGVSRQPGAA